MNLSSTPDRHDPLGPSTHPMISLCPAFRQSFSENDDTRRGTFLHSLANALFTNVITEKDVMVHDFRSQYDLELPDSDREQVLMAVSQAHDSIKWFNTQTDCVSSMVITETWLPLENLGITGGTPDIIVIGDFQHVMCLDFKFGRTHVSPESAQLMSLQTKLIRQYPGGRIFNGVIQPSRHNEPLIHELLPSQIEEHERQMRIILEVARSPEPPRFHNKYCDWCDHFGTCASAKCALIRVADNVPEITELPSDKLAEYYEKAELVKKYAGPLKKELVRRVMAGVSVPHPDGGYYYMSTGADRREWISDDVAHMILKQCVRTKNAMLKPNEKQISESELLITKLIGITAAEKLVGKSKKISDIMAVAVKTKKTAGSLLVRKVIT
jgi:hypothetical protein